MTIDTHTASTQDIQAFLTGAVAPRPIAFTSTIDKNGNPNLSPFSFFNAFSSNPPILIFSPARRGRDNTTKHSYENVKEVSEVVINVVTYDIVQQMSLSSADYPRGVSEFKKAGLTPIPSETIKPFRVKESPVQFECTVKEVVELGAEGGAGNLVICHINRIHISDDILTENGKIDSEKLRIIGRMGGDDYVKAFGESLFQIPKPLSTIGVGIDALPEPIRASKHLTGNELAQLGSVEKLPDFEEEIIQSLTETDFITASTMIKNGEIKNALSWLLLRK